MIRFILILLLVFLNSAYAEQKDEKKLKLGLTHRTRFVSWDNAVDLKEDTTSNSFTRHRTSLTADYKFSSKTRMFFKLTNEFRNYLSPKDRKFDFNEIFIDNIYVDLKNLFNSPMDLRIGRQNLIFGEGFLVMDGQPLTGSRSIFFDAIKGTWNFSKKTKLTIFAGYVPKDDDYSPIINKKDSYLNEQDHLASGLYFNSSFGKMDYEIYFLRKDTKDNQQYPLEKQINSAGFRINTPLYFIRNLYYTMEFAYQHGKVGDADHRSKGGYAYLTYKLPSIKFVDNIKAGFIYLEGDDPATQENEAWDPLFSRWPKWSESYIYTLIKENGIAYWSNIKNLYFSVNFAISSKYSLEGTVMYLESDKSNISHPFPGGTGKKRGNLYKLMLKMELNKNLNSHIVWEYFEPGNFYSPQAEDYNWLRFELFWRF